MNPDLLLANFNRINDAPDAIPRLRRFIMDLAVRGKLVEQNPQEAPAPDLCKLGTADRATKVVDLPANWVRAKVGKLLNFHYGKALSQNVRQETGPVCVFGSNGVVGYCSEFLTEKPAIIIGRKGSAGALNLCNGPSWTTDVAYFVEAPTFFDIRYLFVALQTLNLDKLGKGVKPGLSRSDAYGLDLSVPPIAEQQRIIAKVDELMALCDRLEPAQRERETRRNRLAAAALHHMCNGANPEALREHVRFYLAHLTELTNRPDQIPALRLAILSLAVQGKLVQQNPEDDSAESLLSRVREIREKAANRSKNSTLDDSDPKFVQHLPKNLPQRWVSCPLEELFKFIDYRGRTPTRTPRGVRLITAKNVRMGYLANDPVEYIDERAYKTWMTRGLPQNGDLLFVTEGATMGFVGTIDLQFVFALAQRTIDLQPYLPNYSRFFFFTLMSPIFQEAVLTNSTGTAVKGIKAAKLKRIRVPLPPLAEQHRIVARVGELMAVCDRLETQLTTAQVETSRLLEAVLLFAKTPSGLNPFAISAICKPGNKNPTRGDHSVTRLHSPKILPHAVFADHAKSHVSEVYKKLLKQREWRLRCAEKTGTGFTLPGHQEAAAEVPNGKSGKILEFRKVG